MVYSGYTGTDLSPRPDPAVEVERIKQATYLVMLCCTAQPGQAPPAKLRDAAEAYLLRQFSQFAPPT